MTSPTDFDDLLTQALEHEANRHVRRSGNLARVRNRVAARRQRRRIAAIGFASILLAGVVGVFLWQAGEPDETVVAGNSTTDDVDESGGLSLAPTTTTENLQVPLRPAVIAAVTEDGELVTIEEDQTVLVFAGSDPAAYVGPSSENFVSSASIAPTSGDVWFTLCCEPAAGALYVSGEPELDVVRRADMDGISHGSSDETIVGVNSRGVVILNTTDPTKSLQWVDSRWSGRYQEAALSPNGSVVVTQVMSAGPNSPGPLVVIPVGSFGPVASAERLSATESVIIDGNWSSPRFLDDELLVAIDHGGSENRLISISLTSQERIELQFDVDTPIDLDLDQERQWLLVVESSSAENGGALRWFGPNGLSGSHPGQFLEASW